MPNFTTCKAIIRNNYENPRTRNKPIILKGRPGCAKTAMAYAIADDLGIPRTNVHVTSPPRRNPINYMGLPDVKDEVMVWKEPEELQVLSEGQHVFLIDEIGQCTPIMQNTVSSLLLERRINRLELSPDVLVLGTSNNSDDRAGSKPILTHTANRAMMLDMEYTKDDFMPYAIDQGLDPLGLAFLEFQPGHIHDFDPVREINATPRSWEYALSIDSSMPTDAYMAALSGVLPEGIVAEYIGFRQTAERMPDPEQIRKYPKSAPTPDDGDVRYATVSHCVISTTDGAEFENYMQYIERLPEDFQAVYVAHCAKRVPEVTSTPSYTKWLSNNYLAFGGA